MDEYKQSYIILFSAITDAIQKLDEHKILEARDLLLYAQIDAEEAYISAGEKE